LGIFSTTHHVANWWDLLNTLAQLFRPAVYYFDFVTKTEHKAICRTKGYFDLPIPSPLAVHIIAMIDSRLATGISMKLTRVVP